MVFGIGHDLVHVPRMARLLERWDEAFLARIFTPDERAYCSKFARPAPHFAARFAAKEAFYKALSQGRRLVIALRDVSVKQRGPAPMLVLSLRAARLARSLGVARAHLSLTHEGEYAAAFVVLEAGRAGASRRPGPRARSVH